MAPFPTLDFLPLDRSLTTADRAFALAGRRAFRQLARTGAAAYRRARDLPGLVEVPDAWLTGTAGGRRAAVAEEIIRRLKRALRRERALATVMPWLYSAHRHLALLQALSGELKRLP